MEDFLTSSQSINPLEGGNNQLSGGSQRRPFVFEPFIKQVHNLSFAPVVKQPFSGSGQNPNVGICKYFLKGTCFRDTACPYRHAKPEKSVVCKHWLRGLCKKGDEHCEFLHEYNLKKMPECWFFSKYGECANPDCFYLHVDKTIKGEACQWYGRGFCRHGPHCRNRHVRMVHPKWEFNIQ